MLFDFDVVRILLLSGLVLLNLVSGLWFVCGRNWCCCCCVVVLVFFVSSVVCSFVFQVLVRLICVVVFLFVVSVSWLCSM